MELEHAVELSFVADGPSLRRTEQKRKKKTRVYGDSAVLDEALKEASRLSLSSS